jgi:hypothetical protein
VFDYYFLKSSLEKYIRDQYFISLSPLQRAKPTTMISINDIYMILHVPGLLVIPIDEITIAKLCCNLPVDGWTSKGIEYYSIGDLLRGSYYN